MKKRNYGLRLLRITLPTVHLSRVNLLRKIVKVSTSQMSLFSFGGLLNFLSSNCYLYHFKPPYTKDSLLQDVISGQVHTIVPEIYSGANRNIFQTEPTRQPTIQVDGLDFIKNNRQHLKSTFTLNNANSAFLCIATTADVDQVGAFFSNCDESLGANEGYLLCVSIIGNLNPGKKLTGVSSGTGVYYSSPASPDVPGYLKILGMKRNTPGHDAPTVTSSGLFIEETRTAYNDNLNATVLGNGFQINGYFRQSSSTNRHTDCTMHTALLVDKALTDTQYRDLVKFLNAYKTKS